MELCTYKDRYAFCQNVIYEYGTPLDGIRRFCRTDGFISLGTGFVRIFFVIKKDDQDIFVTCKD